MDPSREVWFPDLVSCPLGGLVSLNNPFANSSDVIKMMDVFSILQEATSDDNKWPDEHWMGSFSLTKKRKHVNKRPL